MATDYTDGGYGGQCSNYVAHRVFGWNDPVAGRGWGPCNGKDMVDYLVKNKGWKYIDSPVDGSVFSTTSGQYGHCGFNENGGSRDSNQNYKETVSFHNFRQGNKFAVPSSYNSTPTPIPTPIKDLDTIANEVIANKWGNNPERKTRLIASGYDYNAVQAKVNDLIKNTPATPATRPESVYIVKSGDTLSQIAKDNGWGNDWSGLARKNGIGNANLIFPGQRIIL